MILFYMDESGTGLKDKRSPFFVLSAIGVPAQEWTNLDTQISAIKRRLVSWAKPEDFEIKGRDMRRGEKFFRMPWEIGFSSFYAGLQLADFVAYLVDFTSNEMERSERDTPLMKIFEQILPKVSLIKIP